MATETTAPKGQMTASDPVFASLGNTDWVKLWSDAPTKIYATGWGEALKLNAGFAQQSVSHLLEDGKKLFDDFRASIALIAPGK